MWTHDMFGVEKPIITIPEPYQCSAFGDAMMAAVGCEAGGLPCPAQGASRRHGAEAG